jgi:hypothetical protein
MKQHELLAYLRDREQCGRMASSVVQREQVPSEGWRWLIRHDPFGAWLSDVAITPSFPVNPVVVEHVLRHLPADEERLPVLEAAIQRGSPDHAAEWWRELAAADTARAARVLVDLPLRRREHLTQGDLDGARVWSRVPAEEAAIIRAEAKPGAARPRLDRWRPVHIAFHQIPDGLKTLGEVYAWASNAEQAEAAVSVLLQRTSLRSWKDEILRWPRVMLTEAIVTELLSATTTAGRDLLSSYPDDPTVIAWVLGWTLDAWRGKYSLVNHAVEKVATELVVDALAQLTIPHGSRLWEALIEMAAHIREWPVARVALYVVLTHPDVISDDLKWLLAGQDWAHHQEWGVAIAAHPMRQSSESQNREQSLVDTSARQRR